ncbi:hypothetical protein E3P94_03573 [Wallemia ichthyophaga]|nr:hypothetical protein E3P95_03566 [Wallemia ichthyophaga]TIA96779.1 hypothetical protein E3P94_03573 [Wallemia ichthyophaga]
MSSMRPSTHNTDNASVSGDSFTEDEYDEHEHYGHSNRAKESNITKWTNFINWRNTSGSGSRGGSGDGSRSRSRNHNHNPTEAGRGRVISQSDTLEQEARLERDRSKFEAGVILHIESATQDTHQLIHAQSRRLDSVDSAADGVALRLDNVDAHINALDTQSDSVNARLEVIEKGSTNQSPHSDALADRIAAQDHLIHSLQLANQHHQHTISTQENQLCDLRSVVSKLQSDLRGLSVLALERIQGLEKSVEKNTEKNAEIKSERSLKEKAEKITENVVESNPDISNDKTTDRHTDNPNGTPYHRKITSFSSLRDENTPSSTTRSPAIKPPTTNPTNTKSPIKSQTPLRRPPGSPVKQSPAIQAKAKQFT